ncbi:MAG: hypothetical protein WCO58_00960 [bacterium]
MFTVFNNLIHTTVFQTVISGVFVFIGSQIFQDYFLKPRQKYREVIARIDNQLKFHSPKIVNNLNLPKNVQMECNEIIRLLSCELEATYKQLCFRSKNRDKKIGKAASLLIGLSNSIWFSSDKESEYSTIQEIRELLNIKELI